jgi:glycosyltransferase involved in cell wall biosynthesis
MSRDVDVSVIAQATARPQLLGNVRVVPTWTPDLRLLAQVHKALATINPDLLHVQHEFNLYGGLMQGALLTAALIVKHRLGTRTVTTIHGVVDPAEITPAFLTRNSLPGSVRLVRSGFRAAYSALDASSDLLVVHHEHFAHVLTRWYGIPQKKVTTIRPGAKLVATVPSNRGVADPEVLVLGFLTGYKLPELVVEVAESTALPRVRFRFCVGRNPRINDRAYSARYADLQQRVRALRGRAEWSGYIPDEELNAAFARASVLVLPYTECVSASAVAAAAQLSRTQICYSRALRPLFGSGPLEFDLSSPSLTDAISRALAGVTETPMNQFIPWSEAALLTENAWRRLLAG